MSFSSGDTVYLCGPNGPVEATLVDSVGPDCLIQIDGQIVPVLCSKLSLTPDTCGVDQSDLAEGERVALSIVDPAGLTRVWPSTIRKIHANGRVQILMDGLSAPQTVDRELLVRL